MQEIHNPYDYRVDYASKLKQSEMFDKDGVQCVLLRGLQRLAHENRGGVKSTTSNVNCCPARENPIAVVTVTYTFNDGTIFSGCADATPSAHDKPYSLHLVAVAEAKAEARALRRAFNINRVSFEEIGTAPVAGGDIDNEPIMDETIHGIQVVAKRKNISSNELFKMTKKDISDLTELTQVEGRKLLKKLTSKNPK